jgi:iron complex transport system permease protein
MINADGRTSWREREKLKTWRTPATTGDAEKAYSKRFARWKIIIALLIVALILTIAVAAAIGPVQISPLDVYKIILQKIPIIGGAIKVDTSPINQEIIMLVRLPRVLAAALVGVALSSSGAVLQGLLRNPIADPFIIGVSAGASLGAAVAMVTGIGASIFGFLYSVPIAAFISAVGTVFLIYNLSRIGGSMSMLTLLLIGVAITSLFSALVYLIMLVTNAQAQGILFWMFGSLTLASWNYVYMSFPFIIAGLAVILYFARDLNPIALGEEQAHHLGVDTEMLKKILLACVSLVTAAAVSISGIIGFIGLIIPHIMRLLVGPDHRMLIPSSALAGAIVLILCDTLARTVMSPSEVPVGIITAILGCPFFIYLLLRSRRGSWLSLR